MEDSFPQKWSECDERAIYLQAGIVTEIAVVASGKWKKKVRRGTYDQGKRQKEKGKRENAVFPFAFFLLPFAFVYGRADG